MNIKSLIITASTLLAASSTVALADSYTVRAQGSIQVGGRVTSGPIVRDHRTTRTPAPVYVDGRNDWQGRHSDDRYNTIRPNPRPVPQPELQIHIPRIDTGAQFSFYEGFIGSTSTRGGMVALRFVRHPDADRQDEEINDFYE